MYCLLLQRVQWCLMENKINKTSLVVIRVTDQEKETLTRAARQASIPLSTWVRMVSIREAGGLAK
jgi:hypothetical protein